MKLKLSTIVFAFCLALLICGVYSFWRGYHNVDLAYNFTNLGYKFDGVISLNDLYIHGLNQITEGFSYILLAVFVLFVWRKND